MPTGASKGRTIRAVFALLSGFLLCLPGRATAQGAVAAPSPAPSLPQKEIRNAYSEGDFDGVIVAIDSFTQTHKTYSQNDSVFIAKYLAVIYTANPLTREKGKHYMFRLLNLQPSARIVDMFASDEINRIFESVREEYVVRRETLAQDGLAKPASVPAVGRKGFSRPFYWVAGGITVAALGAAAFYLLQPERAPDKVYDLPE